MGRLILGFFLPLALWSGVIQTVEEAVETGYPGAAVQKRNLLLTSEEGAAVEKAAGTRLASKIVTVYDVKKEGKVLAHGILRTGPVRTKTQALLVFVNPAGTVDRAVVLAFYEPGEYLPPERWMKLLEGKSSADPLLPKRDLPNLTGATLSARAAAREVRTALAVWNVKLSGEEQ